MNCYYQIDQNFAETVPFRKIAHQDIRILGKNTLL